MPKRCLCKEQLETYKSQKAQIIADEESKIIGASLVLSEQEERVNEILLRLKREQVDAGLKDPQNFIGAQHIIDVKDNFDKSEIFDIIKILPKGASLHCHDLALVSYDFLYSLTITYSDDLYACMEGDTIKLKFMKDSSQDTSCTWTKIEEMRQTQSNFEDLLKAQLTLLHPANKYLHGNDMWINFMNCFIIAEPLICYEPVFKKYFYQALQELYDDNVMYLEFRTILPTVYDLDNKTYGPIEVAGFYKEVTDDFLSTHKDFLGVKLIYAPVRFVDQPTMLGFIETAITLSHKYPDFFGGFDLVGQEDMGSPLSQFLEKLKSIPSDINFFFHAGETNWYGTEIDLNLIDAVLLGATRIGHAFAAVKHLEVLDIMKMNGMAMECCPISNQILGLVDDLRNHPAVYLIANDYPIVICNDDPTFWGTKALSHDWYMTFMAMTSRNTGLKFLKQLARNSIKYSVIEDLDQAFKLWETKWDDFINKVLSENIGNA